MFRIKICGVTNVPDAITAVDAGADAIGLNFYEKSPRFITDEVAASIIKATPPDLKRVGVFVNHEADEIHRVMAELGHQPTGLHAVQLHGDEPAFLLRSLRFRHIIRARRFDKNGVAAITNDLINCDKCGHMPNAVLIDAHSPGAYGGTGETVSWAGLADHKRWLKVPLILAGGLTPDNVAEAIRIVRPHGVDVASGVESTPGKKDPHKVRDFIAAARAAFDAL
jgi:phosphoribosylanthranilate isomerase